MSSFPDGQDLATPPNPVAPNRISVVHFPQSERVFDVPAPLHPLVGRVSILAALVERISRPDVRLMTVTGPGGVGKTRLALEAAHGLTGRYERIHFIPLASIVDPALLPPTLVRGAGAGDEPNVGWVQRIASRAREQRVLLILDNLEQISDAGSVIAELIAGSARIDVLATSREPLHVDGEHEFLLPCLELPDRTPVAADLAQSEAVALFVARVQRFDPDFALTGRSAPVILEVCRLLDGLPLAIELAAARMKVLSPEALRERLRDHIDIDVLAGGPRNQLAHQQTMRDTIEWSYRLLSPSEQRMLRWLSVFSMAFPFSAVETICARADGSAGSDAIELVQSLVEKSLLRRVEGERGEPAFFMLATIRSFARDLAKAEGEEDALRTGHAAWCMRLVEGYWSVPVVDFIPPLVLGRIDAQFNDLQRALEWFDRQGDATSLLRMTAQLAPYWTLRSFRAEGSSWLRRALSQPGIEDVPMDLRAGAYLASAALARTQGDLGAAEAWCRQSLALYRKIGDPMREAAVLNLLGAVSRAQGDFVTATQVCEESLAIFGNYDDPSWTALLNCNLGVIAFWRGKTREARAYVEAAARGYRAAGNEWGLTFTLMSLGLIRCAQGDPRAASEAVTEGLRLARAVESRECLIDGIAATAVIAVAAGAFGLAATFFGSVEALCRTIDYALEQPEQQHYGVAAKSARQAIGSESFARAFDRGRGFEFAAAVDEAVAWLGRITTSGAPGASAVSGVAGPMVAAELTSREHQVLALLLQRFTDREIAETLFISTRTVSRHVSNIFDKLGVRSRREAAQLFENAPPR
ncbi:MAG TPA: LuxR C-terminal-related transcriptional regulator [Thermomicrobiales bacterium]|nr:LuxR C-terminal-related transcriptional regulator [Thermomicrobiales bacterium]